MIINEREVSNRLSRLREVKNPSGIVNLHIEYLEKVADKHLFPVCVDTTSALNAATLLKLNKAISIEAFGVDYNNIRKEGFLYIIKELLKDDPDLEDDPLLVRRTSSGMLWVQLYTVDRPL